MAQDHGHNAKAARRRGPGRNALQERQRLATRDKLLAAARVLFVEKSYAETSVEDILAAAKVSRAAFYSQFPSKYAVVQALFADIAPALDDVFEQLGALERFDQPHLEQWLSGVLAIHARNKNLFAVFEDSFASEATASNSLFLTLPDRLIETLGPRIPAFALAGEDSERGREMYFRLILLLQRIGWFSFTESVYHPEPFRDVGIRVIADDILRFIQLGGQPKATKRKS